MKKRLPRPLTVTLLTSATLLALSARAHVQEPKGRPGGDPASAADRKDKDKDKDKDKEEKKN